MPDRLTANRPSVSVVIVTRGRPELLRACLQSCAAQDYPDLEVVVVLNPDEPSSAAVIREAAPRARVIRTHRNLGFFPALNLAIANADGEFIMTVDDDSRFLSPEVISRMVTAFISEPELGALTCNVEGPSELPLEPEDRYVHLFRTGFTMVAKKTFTHDIGFYPDLFFRSAGETFLATGLWDRGQRVKCLAGVRMYHDLAMTGRSSDDWWFHGLRSQLLCAVIREPFLVLPGSLGSKFFKSLATFARGGHLGIWMRAWSSFMVHLPECLAQRRPISWRTRQLMDRLKNERVTTL